MHKKGEVASFGEKDSTLEGERLVLPEEVGLHPSEYKKLFGKTFGDGHDSKPWKRGIVRVCGEKKVKNPGTKGDEAYRKIALLLRFRGYNPSESTNESAYLHPLTASRLGVTSDSGGEGHDLWLESAPPYWGRFLFYWNHPTDTVRAAFKLGVLGAGTGAFSIFLTLAGWICG